MKNFTIYLHFIHRERLSRETKETTLFSKQVWLFIALCLFFNLGVFAQSANLDQVRNGSVASPESPGAWINGNLGPTQAHLAEGFSVPYRAILSDMPSGTSVTFTIGYDIKENGKHAIDYLTHYDRSEPHFLAFGHSPREVIDPTIGVLGVTLNSSATDIYEIPSPPVYMTPVAGQPTNSFTGVRNEVYNDVNGANVPGSYMSIWNGEITNITYGTPGDLSAASSEQQVSITLLVSGNIGDPAKTVLLAWGGHIASRLDWGETNGEPNSAGGISGSPYHMRIIGWSLGNLGQQDRSLKADAVVPPPDCIFTDGTDNLCEGGEGTYTIMPVDAGFNPIYSWEIVPGDSGAYFDPPNPGGTTATVIAGDNDFKVVATITSNFGTVNCEYDTEVDASPYAGVDGDERFCQADESKDAVNLFELITEEDAGGSWADTDASGVDISDPTMVDFTTLAAGSYTFTYTVTPAQGSECIADSAEVEIVIDAPVNAGGDGSVQYCEEDSALSAINLLTIITQEEPGGSWADTDASGVDISDPTMVDFTQLTPGTYTFTYTVTPEDENSTCPDDQSVASITIDDALYAGVDGDERFCQADESKDAVNLFELITEEDAGGSWADTDASGVDISDPTMVDFTTLAAGSYTFTYTVTPAQGSECIADSAEVEIVIDAPVNAGGDGSVQYCEEDSALSAINLLTIITQEEPGGSWADTDASGVDISDPTMVDFTQLTPGTYTFTYTVTPEDENSTCPDDQSVASITIDDALYAGVDGDERFCQADESKDAVNLFELITEEDAGGSWADTDASGVDISDPTMVDFTTLAAGSYTFTYTVTPAQGSECIADSAEVEIVIDALPIIPDYQTSLADCIGGDGGIVFIDAGENLFYSIDGGDFILYEGEISLEEGTYEFRIRYMEDGCISSPFIVKIESPIQESVSLISEVEQPDCETFLGAIFITNAETLGNLSYTVTQQESNTIYYSEVNYPAEGFNGLPPGTYDISAISGDGCKSGNTTAKLVEPVCEDFEGCTLGYWKNHTDRWCDEYQTCTEYGEIFKNAPSSISDMSLLEALNAKGGGIMNLARQSVAALLNACSDKVAYEIATPAEVIAYVNARFEDAGTTASYLDILNNAGCSLGGSRATTDPSPSCIEDPGESNNFDNVSNSSLDGFSAWPVPFKEVLNIEYNFTFTANAIIEIYDLKGQLLRTFKADGVTKGDVTKIQIDFALRGNQFYIVNVTANGHRYSKTVISGRGRR